MVERPLQPQFRDATGMVHNRREFWERTFDDAYELAYETYVVLGFARPPSSLRRRGRRPRGEVAGRGRQNPRRHAAPSQPGPGRRGAARQAPQPDRRSGGPQILLSLLMARCALSHRAAPPLAAGRHHGPAHRLSAGRPELLAGPADFGPARRIVDMRWSVRGL